MLRPSLLVFCLTASLLSGLRPGGLAAQEPQPRPERDVVRERIPFFGRVEVFTTRRGRLGVVVNPVAVETDTIGALIQSVTPNGPAAKAGLKAGDIIVRVNGKSLVEGDIRAGRRRFAPGVALSLIAATIDAGDSVVVQYQRGKERRNVTVVAGDEPVWAFKTPDGAPFGEADDLRALQEGLPPEMRLRGYAEDGLRGRGHFEMRTPMPRMFMLGSPLADLELAPLNPDLGRYFGTSEGVLVINVPGESHLGLRPGDVVFSVDGRKVRAPSQLFRVLQSYEQGEAFKLDIMRMKKRETVTGSVEDESAPPR
jgi:membrane-associated protease RseP (regulator of RpoE activity)